MRVMKTHLRDTMNPFEMPERQLIKMFRLNKRNVINLITQLESFANQQGSIPLHLKVPTMLNFVSTDSFQNPVGRNCCISLSQPSVSRIIKEMCSMKKKKSTKQRFYEKWGARGVLEAIDGTHVEIIAPPITDEEHPPFVYINRKGRHSMNVMIANSDTKIIGCNAKFPGSVHDAAIWQISNIKNYLSAEYANGDKLSHLLRMVVLKQGLMHNLAPCEMLKKEQTGL